MSNNHLILGLGGTGGKVIREIRKLLISSGHLNYEQGDTKFEFLYVDTSTDELDKTEDWIPVHDTSNYKIISFTDILEGKIPNVTE